jgi:leucyl aminopeptidase
MEFSTKVIAPELCAGPCVAVGVFDSGRLSAAAQAVDRASKGALRDLVAKGDLPARTGATRLLYKLPGVAAQRVLVVGLGKEEHFGAREYLAAAKSAVQALAETGAQSGVMYFAELPVKRRDAAWKARHFMLAAADATYRFEQLKSEKSQPRPLSSLVLGCINKANAPAIEKGAAEGNAIGAGVSLARDLGNLPGNICTPTYLANEATRLARAWKLGIEVLEQRDMEKLGMGSLLSVSKGSRQPPKLIILRYSGGSKKEKPVVLVGKGITFDTGGISLKPGAEMDEMKFDMCGAASVLGTLRAAAQMKLRANIIGMIPTCENMPDGAASKPGDIVTSLSGQTIEILNTDAEGRLILCDALTYAERFEPAAVVDIATLTGACVIALGHVASGLYANDEGLSRELVNAGEESWDRAWPMPLWDDYQDQLKSNFADMANIGGRPAGSVTAACFLSRYTGKYDWAHLDIAGTAWKSGKEKGSTGRPVPLLTSFLMKRAGKLKG